MQLACELLQFPQPEPSGHQGMATQALHSWCRGAPASELMWGYPGGYCCCLCPNKELEGSPSNILRDIQHESCCSSKGQTMFLCPDQQKPLEKVAEVLRRTSFPRSHDSTSLETLKHPFPPSLVCSRVQIHLGPWSHTWQPDSHAWGLHLFHWGQLAWARQLALPHTALWSWSLSL